ncbi:PfkB domain protein [Thioalkalivibrio sp. K90mix]|uniref:carbohydrate kinase family protein n=1 Tax=unclassified Thioalkalivibrio TaxID=2621013 RepID=UPI000195A916|nr:MULTISPECIES: carbohydrate kinase [unclassified Thioalkalivibrio]ADC70550.1 PfkB domain protein [Thioalkalivibrio sp. K90mix]
MIAEPSPQLIFGEVLFDVFPDGQRVLGGAPFNVAWNLHQLGEPVCFVGGIGNDPAGAAVQARMDAIGMDARGLYRHPEAPTGEVRVELARGEPSYTIVPDQAYDDVPAAWADALPASTPLLYHGTLALRRGNHDLLARLRERAGHRFVDVNLRDPWYTRDTTLDLIRDADVVKLNQDELATLVPGAEDDEAEAALLEQAGIRQALVVTAGADGASIRTINGERFAAPAPSVPELRDAVGAGDAFASVVLLGMRQGWDWPATLERALAFAAAVCTLQGATSDDPGFYQGARNSWD